MKVTALAGGIGAAKFLLGLQDSTPVDEITIIANTGDDIELYGLRICPDIDTVTYTLAGVVNQATGWGVANDTFACLSSLARYWGPAWFNLGDRDLATHMYRTQQLRSGRSLTEVTDEIRSALGVGPKILPMTDAYAPTTVVTDEGEMHLQEYFVRRKCEPRVRQIRCADPGAAAPGVEQAIKEAAVAIICPSNPFISIGPILATPGVIESLRVTTARVVAITPIVGGRALKGPTAEMLRDLGHEVSSASVARLYREFVDSFVLDNQDANLRSSIEAMGIRVLTTDTVMDSPDDKRRLACEVLDWVTSDAARGGGRLQQ